MKVGPEIVPGLLEVLDASTIQNTQVVVIAFDEDVVGALKKARPGIRAMLLSSFKRHAEGFRPTSKELIAKACAVDADGISVKAVPEVVSAEFVKQAEAAGLEVHVWTVDDPAVAGQVRTAGVRSITTNRPAFLRASITPQKL